MADITAIGGSFGAANSFGGTYYGVIQQQVLQNYTLVVDDSVHGHSADAVVVTQQHILVVANALHGHTADNVTIVQQHTLVVDNTVHGVTYDTPWLIYNTPIVVADALHGHTFDNVTITQQHSLVVNDALHGHIVDNVTIIQQHTIVVNDTTHGLTLDGNLGINQFLLMNKPDDSYHGLSIDSTSISSNHVLIVSDAIHRLSYSDFSLINWADLEKYFGLYKPGTGQYGGLTASELAEIKRLYSNLVFENGSLNAVEIELGIHKKQYGEIGELLAIGLLTGMLKPSDTSGDLLLQSDIDSGTIIKNAIDIGNFLSDKPLSVLMFENGFAWLSEDGIYHILEEAGNADKIEAISSGILKQGKIEYGRL